MKKKLFQIIFMFLVLPSFLMAVDIGTINDTKLLNNETLSDNGWDHKDYKFKATQNGTYTVKFNATKNSINMKAGYTSGSQDFFRDTGGAKNSREDSFEVSANQDVYLRLWKEGDTSPVDYNLEITFNTEKLIRMDSKPFSCQTSGTVVSYVTSDSASEGDSNIALISIADGSINSNTKLPDPTIGVNSIGYNVQDNYVWGYNIPSRKVVRIGSDNSINYYNVDSNVIGKHGYYNTADVSSDGILYMKADGSSKQLDRVKLDGSKDTQHVLSSINLDKELNTADFAFNPKDKKIYFIDYKDGWFKRIDITGTQGKLVRVKDINMKVYTIITAFDVDGNFYYNQGQDIHRLKITYNGNTMDKSSITHKKNFSKVNGVTQGDGARCANAKVEKAELIADYHFDECFWDGTEEEVKDSSGNNHNGTSFGKSNTIDMGEINRAGDFSAIKVDDEAGIKIKNMGIDSNKFSISMWAKTKNKSTDNNYSVITRFGAFAMKYYHKENKFVIHTFHPDHTSRSVNAGNFNDNKFHHIYVSIDSGKLKLYMDDKLIHEENIRKLIEAYDTVYIGGKEGTDKWRYGALSIDEVKFYNGKLDDSKIKDIYDNEKDGKNADGTERKPIVCKIAKLIADYHFDECAFKDGSVKDTTTKYNGVVDGDVKTTDDSEEIINRMGIFKSGKIDVENLPVDTTEGMKTSISMWLKMDGTNTHASMPIAWDGKHYDLFIADGYFGFNTFNTDMYGVPDGIIKDDKWHHIVAIFNNGDVSKSKLYIDGVKQNLEQIVNSHFCKVSSTSRDTVSNTLHIGAASDGKYKYKGLMDELKIYTSSLKADDVTTIYNNEKAHKNADGSDREEVVCGTPFVCQETPLLFSNQTKMGTGEGDESSMWLHSIDKKQSPFSFTPIGDAYDKTYNALAYNPKDNFLYATYKNNLLKIDKNATVTDLGVIEDMEDIQHYSGVIDREGFYYVGNWNKDKRDEIYKIDLKKRKVIKTIKLNYNGARKTLWYVDLAISSDDKYFYLINGKTVQDPDMRYPTQLAKVDKKSGEVTFIGDKVYEHLAEAVFADKDNKLYALYHEGGFYEIDTNTGERIPVSTAPITSDLQDGANCPNAAIVIDKPERFECNQNSYIFSSDKNATYSKATVVNLIDGNVITAKEKFGSYHINAIGFNPLDGFIYGWQSDEGPNDWTRPNAHLVKVDSNYNVFDVYLNKQIPDSKQRYILGDVSKEGIYYMADMSGHNDHGYYLHKIRVVDLNKTEFVKDIDIVYPHAYPDNKSEHIKNADFAINPVDNNLYMINSNNNQLVKIYLNGSNAGEFEEMGQVYEMNPNFDVDEGNNSNTFSVFSFFDKNGNLYFQIGKRIYKIDISDPWSGKNDTKAKAKVFTSTTLNSSGDGARCALTDMGSLPIIELEIQDTLEGNEGVSDVNITFKLDRELDKDISIRYSTFILDDTKNSAVSGNDFKADSRVITIVKGSSSISIPVVIGDIEVESDEKFGIKLESDEVLFLDSVDGVSEDISLVATIKDDDYSKLNAYDVNDDSDRQIKTKVVKEPFTLDIVALSPDGNSIIDFSEDMNKTKVKFVDSSECVTEIEDLNKSGFMELGELPEHGELQKEFIKNLALKDIKVQFWWENKFGEQTVCSSDNFAIRPKTFSFEVGMSEQSVVKAGEDFNVTIKALDQNNTSSLNYDGQYDEQTNSFKIDFKQKSNHCDFNSSDLTVNGDDLFKDGVLEFGIKYKDVGVLDINISEIAGKEFAKVDSDDTPESQRFIQKAHREIRFIPYGFDVNSAVINNMTKESSGYAFYSNHIDKSPMWSINVKAINEAGHPTKNYNNECAARDVDIYADINISSMADSTHPLFLNISEDGASLFSLDSNITTSGEVSKNRVKKILKARFKDGVADKNITINFKRSKLVEQEPATIKFIKAKAVDDDVIDNNVTGEDTPNKSITYKYMRAYIQSPIEVIVPREEEAELNTTVYYEAYEPNSSGKRSVSGERGWKRVDFDDTSGKMRFENLQVAYGGRVIPTNEGNQTLNVIATKVPERNKITMDIDDDFQYVLDHISTDISFTPSSANWAGDGNLGMMVDTNVSRQTRFKRMDW